MSKSFNKKYTLCFKLQSFEIENTSIDALGNSSVESLPVLNGKYILI